MDRAELRKKLRAHITGGADERGLMSMYIYIYICAYVYIYIYIHISYHISIARIHIHIDRLTVVHCIHSIPRCSVGPFQPAGLICFKRTLRA